VAGAAVEVFVKTGVVNDVPAVPAPPVFVLYHMTFPLVQLAVSVVVFPEQIVGAEDEPGGVGFGFIVTVGVALELTQFGEPPLSQAAK
jgi:hypothetical protein